MSFVFKSEKRKGVLPNLLITKQDVGFDGL